MERINRKWPRRIAWAGVVCAGVAAVVLCSVGLPAYWGDAAAQVLAFVVLPAVVAGGIVGWQARRLHVGNRSVEQMKRILTDVPRPDWQRNSELFLAPLAPGRILIVDDNPLGQVGTAEAVHELGHEGTVVPLSGAAEACERSRYDLVLLNCRPPVEECLEVASRIRASEEDGHRIPVIAISPQIIGSELREFREAGIDDLLVKPIRRAELARALQRWLEIAPARLPEAQSSLLPEAHPGPRA